MTAAQSSPGSHAWRSLVALDASGPPRRTAVSASGNRITFADGTEALDGTSGLWNVNLGFGNEAIADAVADALRRASYLTLFRYGHEYAERAAAALLDAAGSSRFGRVLFSTSGGAANDAAIKLARHYALLRGDTRRTLVVSLRGSYHGLTFGGFALTGEPLGQAAYGVDQRLVRHVDHDHAHELEALLAREGPRVAAVVVEPLLGSGARVLGDPFLRALLAGREEHGYIVVADEVATGFGRTGPLFAHERWPAAPDVVLLSKALTNGTCGAAALVISHAISDAFEQSGTVLMHAETQAGTPPSCAAILAVLDELARLDALGSARRVAARLDQALDRLGRGFPQVTAIAGLGCFRAIALTGVDGEALPAEAVHRVVEDTLRAGAIVHPGPGCVQLVPSLLSSDEDVDLLVERLGLALGRLLERSAL